jgi:hypothetical protein
VYVREREKEKERGDGRIIFESLSLLPLKLGGFKAERAVS